MKTFVFTTEQVKFIKDGTGITFPANVCVSLRREQAEAIFDYSCDIESDEVLKVDNDTDISPFGRLASSIIDMLTAKELVSN